MTATCGKRTRPQLQTRAKLLAEAIKNRTAETESVRKRVGELEALKKATEHTSYTGMTPAQIELYWDERWNLSRSIDAAKRTVVCLGSTVELERHYLERTTAELTTAPAPPAPPV